MDGEWIAISVRRNRAVRVSPACRHAGQSAPQNAGYLSAVTGSIRPVYPLGIAKAAQALEPHDWHTVGGDHIRAADRPQNIHALLAGHDGVDGARTDVTRRFAA
jgi:hypothetical protein